MAVRKPVRRKSSNALKPGNDPLEPQVMAFADQLGWSLGTIRVKADSWLDREALRIEVARVRDAAGRLLDLFAYEAGQLVKDGTTPAEPSPVRASRGAVDAPGKRHRKPPPQERMGKHLGEVVGKKAGTKNVKNAMHGRA